MTPSEMITIGTGIASILGGLGIAIKGLVNLNNHLDERFDLIEKSFYKKMDTLGDSMSNFLRSYEVDRERLIARIEKLEYRLSQEEARLNHKSSRFENAINQVAAFLEKNHSYHPRQIFPISSDE